MGRTPRRAALAALALLGACNRAPEGTPPVPSGRPLAALAVAPASSPAVAAGVAPAQAASVARAPSGSASSAEAPAPAAPSRSDYPWLAAGVTRDALATRFPAPAGFSRVPVAPRSFPAWLRTLPLTPPGTAVTSFRGDVICAADDARVAAVVDLDVGTADLQQCADTIIRLHAEWSRVSGAKDIRYWAASGDTMSLARWEAGERPVAKGSHLGWSKSAAAAPADRASFRRYLDSVFAYANTVAIEQHGKKIAPADLVAGDYFVQGGWPGHAVVVLDVARASDGRRVALFGQGFMPAQSLHVLRGEDGSPWFSLDPAAAGVKTPFWQTFPWGALRRF